jgi:hypothetical protein
MRNVQPNERLLLPNSSDIVSTTFRLITNLPAFDLAETEGKLFGLAMNRVHGDRVGPDSALRKGSLCQKPSKACGSAPTFP